MTTDEHLELILIFCRSRLALAEKRTPGAWNLWPTSWAGGNAAYTYDGSNCPWISATGKDDIARVNPRGTKIYRDPEVMANAAFIAACAGAAEAGWRATIEGVQCARAALRDIELVPPVPGSIIRSLMEGTLRMIREAYPLELLTDPTT